MAGKVDGLKRFVMQPTPNVPHHCQRPALNVMSSVPFWRKKLEIFIEKSRVDLVWGFCPSYIEGQFSCFYCVRGESIPVNRPNSNITDVIHTNSECYISCYCPSHQYSIHSYLDIYKDILLLNLYVNRHIYIVPIGTQFSIPGKAVCMLN